MNQDQPSESTTQPGPASQGRFRMPWTALIAIAALLVVGWNWWDMRQQVTRLQRDLAQRLADTGNQVKRNETVAEQAREVTQQLQGKLAVVENKLAESQNQQVALEALYQELSRSRDEWSLTETEQILNIASQQLQLAGNVSAALVALQAADSRLQRVDQPQLAGVRKAIDQDIQKLKALPYVDAVGIAVKLDNLILSVDVLPLQSESPPSAEERPQAEAQPTGFWGKLAKSTWHEIKDAIRIQRLDARDQPLLSPEQAYFLRQNLKLRLLSARLALLARDETSYRADLTAAQEWVRHYFATNAKGVRNTLAILRELVDGDIAIAIPDISTSLEAVRNYKAPREGAAQ
jgi:uroporphyrin-III C-methyltransferase